MKQGADFQVNDFTSFFSERPAVATNQTGDFVVAWQSYDNQDGYGVGVFARRFSSAGAKLGSEFQVNTYTVLEQRFPAIASDDAGNFVVAWESDTFGNFPQQDGSGAGVFGQAYDSSGSPLGGEFQVNTYTPESQSQPSAGCAPGGGCTIGWTGPPTANSVGNSTILLQDYTAAGARQGGEIEVDTGVCTPGRAEPDVCRDSLGNFVVAFDKGLDGSYSGVFAQLFDSGGALRGTEFQVNSYTPFGQY